MYLEQLISLATPNKYTKWYTSIITNATGDHSYTERHHILPKSFGLGGEADEDNIIVLSAREHFIVHCCLARMFTGALKAKMLFALKRMRSARADQYRYYNSHAFEFAKREYRDMPKKCLYKGDRKRLAYTEDEMYQELLADGWSPTMSDEYKLGRVGQMAGKIHSEETKEKQRIAHIGRIHRPWTEEEKLNLSVKSTGRKQTESQKLAKSERLIAEYKKGLKEKPIGNKNPMFGRKRKAAYNPETLECRYVDITNSSSELDALLESGWKLGLLRKSNQT